MNNTKLEYVENAKYLGIIICNDLKDDEDICVAFVPSLTVSFENVITVPVVFDCIYFTHIVFCSQLWVNFNKGTYLKVTVAYDNMHRRILVCLFLMLSIIMTHYCAKISLALQIV